MVLLQNLLIIQPSYARSSPDTASKVTVPAAYLTVLHGSIGSDMPFVISGDWI
jgi:hypothetical protein